MYKILEKFTLINKMRYSAAIIILQLLVACSSTRDVTQKLISTDSLYLSQNTIWQDPDSNIKYLYSDSTIFIKKMSRTTLIKVDGNSFRLINTSIIQTSEDSILLFWPPDDGGLVLSGIISDSIITSHTKTLNDKNIKWTIPETLEFDKTVYQKITNANINWLVESISKYLEEEGADSARIVLAGP